MREIGIREHAASTVESLWQEITHRQFSRGGRPVHPSRRRATGSVRAGGRFAPTEAQRPALLEPEAACIVRRP